jgi:hypothetical protein
VRHGSFITTARFAPSSRYDHLNESPVNPQTDLVGGFLAAGPVSSNEAGYQNVSDHFLGLLAPWPVVGLAGPKTEVGG